jgi:hypothetical protein
VEAVKQLTEKDLLVKFSDAKKAKARIESELEKAIFECDRAEAQLMELLTSKNATATANYEGLGKASLVKPRLYASCLKENEALLFKFLEDSGRVDLVKQTVNSQSLSGFIKERVEAGENVPEFITYHLRPSLRLYD